MSFDSKETALGGDLAAIERALASLTPAPPRIERDRLMFLAGQRSVQPRRIGSWFWAASAAAMAFLAVTLAVVEVRHDQGVPPTGRAGGSGLLTHTAHNEVGTSDPTVSAFGFVPSRWQYGRLRRSGLGEALDTGEGVVIAPVTDVRDERLFQLRSRWLRGEI